MANQVRARGDRIYALSKTEHVVYIRLGALCTILREIYGHGDP